MISAQSVSDYAYVYVPKKFASFKTTNQYNLNKILALKLADKNYKIILEERENWSENLNRCDILTADLLDDSNMFKNRVKLEFKDCNGKTLSSIPSTSNFKEFDAGFQDALIKSLASVPNSQNTGQTFAATQNVQKTQVSTPEPVKTIEKVIEQKIETPIKTVESQPVTTVQKPAETKTTNKAEVYSNGKQNFNRVNLGAGHFILTSPNSSIPYAVFKESLKKDVFRVQLENGTQTLGYWEGNKLIIEKPNADGTFSKEELKQN